jgi:hypothetical protein
METRYILFSALPLMQRHLGYEGQRSDPLKPAAVRFRQETTLSAKQVAARLCLAMG